MEDGEIDDESASIVSRERSNPIFGDAPHFAVGTYSNTHRPRYARSHSDVASRQRNANQQNSYQRSQSQDYGSSQQNSYQRSQSQDYGSSQQNSYQRSQSQDYGSSQQNSYQRSQSQDYGSSQQNSYQRSQSQDYGSSQQNSYQRSQSQDYGSSQQNSYQRSQSQDYGSNHQSMSREPLLYHPTSSHARSPLLGAKPLPKSSEVTYKDECFGPQDISSIHPVANSNSNSNLKSQPQIDSNSPKPPPVPQPPPPPPPPLPRHPCVEAFDWEAATLRIVYDGVPAVVRVHLERFILDSLLSKDYWNLHYSKNASDVDDWRVLRATRVKYYPGLIEDRTGSSELLEQNPSDICDITVPWYSRVTNYALPFQVEGRQINGSILSKCFNCGMPNHELRDCKMPRSDQDIEANRQEFNSSLPPRRFDGRYHIDGEDPCDLYKPGVLTERLRQALGMSETDPPPYLKKMRRFGLPPGFKDGYENEPVVIPGLNAPLPEGVRDPDVEDDDSYLGRRSHSNTDMSTDVPVAKRIKRDEKSDAKAIQSNKTESSLVKPGHAVESLRTESKNQEDGEVESIEGASEDVIPSNWAKIKRTLSQERGQIQ
eukprot:TRINITY_DN2157_c0_g2_i1.p1 TRINITY_DN2157_c0_g2~~TRINITY_DN2157_c0_g2_i1.p1  ORF type:complete len:597 (-),score=105.61 TRINITY_DN2157_c0_g2_i1:49-1839(-)